MVAMYLSLHERIVKWNQINWVLEMDFSFFKYESINNQKPSARVYYRTLSKHTKFNEFLFTKKRIHIPYHVKA